VLTATADRLGGPPTHRTGKSKLPRSALSLAEDTISEIFTSLGLDTTPLFEACHEEMARAIQSRVS
jgi:hypothetical protein